MPKTRVQRAILRTPEQTLPGLRILAMSQLRPRVFPGREWLVSAVQHGLGCSLDVREFIIADNHGLGCSLDVHGRNEDRRGLGCSLDAALR